MPIAIWNATTGANRTVTIDCMWNGTTVPNNDYIWIETDYFGTASSTLGSRATSGKATWMATGTALTASTTTWTGIARGNSTAYVLGNTIAVPSTGGVTRIFICTQAGTSAASLPGAYATATDGTSGIADGGATFACLVRFLLTVTLSSPQPQAPGYITCYVKVGLTPASSATLNNYWWLNPSPVLT
jgi:hypothetical protein